jgi:hypothetical protein
MASTAATAGQHEVRSIPFRPSPSARDLQKLIRARRDRLWLMGRQYSSTSSNSTAHRLSCPQQTFMIRGTSRHTYTVVINEEPSCTCPDARYNPRHTCKHVIYVFTRVLNVPQSSYVWYQKSLLRSEVVRILGEVGPNVNTPQAGATTTTERRQETPPVTQRQGSTHYSATPLRTTPAASLPARAQSSVPRASTPIVVARRIPQAGDESCCPICLDAFLAGQTQGLTFCEGCGNACHTSCLKIWISGTSSGNNTCICCRKEWSNAQRVAILSEVQVEITNENITSATNNTQTSVPATVNVVSSETTRALVESANRIIAQVESIDQSIRALVENADTYTTQLESLDQTNRALVESANQSINQAMSVIQSVMPATTNNRGGDMADTRVWSINQSNNQASSTNQTSVSATVNDAQSSSSATNACKCIETGELQISSATTNSHPC